MERTSFAMQGSYRGCFRRLVRDILAKHCRSMAQSVGAGLYFSRKREEWIAHDGSVAVHVDRAGTTGLVREFQHDPKFDPVREALKLNLPRTRV